MAEARREFYERARTSPTRYFHRPEEIVDHPDLSRTQKIDILHAWYLDASNLSVAEEEGMGGGEDENLDEIRACLRMLGIDNGDLRPSPTKHGSNPPFSDERASG